ncbi:hypothetical protein CHU_3549 [Cytophaga hutchinsonii ATCC 33406]|uniref:Uncharacterized protein n=1 Tax=Cytophaga hutchinsonii (strain ATCC 33406 / DSM 1761 / CIP 103989 / NBRC 15051 / NCIMB 9469 / D465) TaxID=269798 RepID=A0A6N4SWR1_CYTH3|nr:hypothetical protein CHU_3549 [Cytophaga hutchinsonii ATCC 33406]
MIKNHVIKNKKIQNGNDITLIYFPVINNAQIGCTFVMLINNKLYKTKNNKHH